MFQNGHFDIATSLYNGQQQSTKRSGSANLAASKGGNYEYI